MKRLLAILLFACPLLAGAQQQMFLAPRTYTAPDPGPRPDSLDNLVFWYRSDTLVRASGGTLTTTNGTEVGQWDDISGNGYHLTQITAGRLPVYTSSAVNSLPGITFDGVNDRMILANFSGALNQPNTVIAVFRVLDGSQSDFIFDGRGGAGNRHALQINATTSRYQIIASLTLSPGSGTNVSTTGYHYVIAEFNTASSAYYLDNATPAAVTGDAGTGVFNGLTVGANTSDASAANMTMVELIGYDDLLSAGERARLAQYIEYRYGL